MKLKKFNRIRRNTYYVNNSKDKKFLKRQFKRIFISVLIVTAIIIIKLFNTDFSNKTIEIIEKNIKEDRSIKADGLVLLKKVKEVEVFNNKIFDFSKESSGKSIFPVSGRVYRNYGIIDKGEGVEVFNKGIDIIANESRVKAIADGIIVDIGINNIYGKYMIIKHGDIFVKYYGFEKIYKGKKNTVERGEELGTLEKNNNELEFRIEVYEDNKPINPLKKINFDTSDILFI